jgi:hypothetical protein
MKFETFKADHWHPRFQPTQLHVVLASPGLFLSHLNPEVSRFSL